VRHLTLTLATARDLAWAQQQVTLHHYLRAPVDARCRVLGYVVRCDAERAGCLLFGRPEAARCYTGDLTYGSAADVAAERACFDRWEILNLARVWLDPRLQRGGADYAPNAASWAIGQALRSVVVDYLAAYPPCFLDEPWQLQMCLSYCDTRQPGHHGTIYQAAGFWRVRVNEAGIETWARPLRRLRGRERTYLEQISAQTYRSRVYRSRRAAGATQEGLPL
jgi:hypothetical protein